MGIFKAYDIRGIYPSELDEKLAHSIGNAMARFINKSPVVVGRDVRVSSPSVAQALIEGILDFGINVIDIGICTTPMNYFAIGHLNAAGGVMTTASHNPAQYNGFKLCKEKAIALSYERGISDIEKIVSSGEYKKASQRGKLSSATIIEPYSKHIRTVAGTVLPLKIVIDAGNGATGLFINEVFGSLNCKIYPLFFEPDGRFPNHEANPLKLENLRHLQKQVKEVNADIGVAFDGDGDRCAFIDENADVITSDIVTALIAKQILKIHQGGKILYDLRSSLVVPEEIKASGGEPIRSRVGHAYMKEIMRDKDVAFGGELSGHYYFRENYYADSGFLALATVLSILSKEKKHISELVNPLKRYYATGEINFEVKNKDAKIEEISKIFADAEIDYLDGITVSY
ncbi:MAG: phosphomannomutase/phosphoglucomutase, partial [Planctomycetota bacterium]